MTDHGRPAEDTDGDVRRLLELAGPRLQPPADVEDRIRAATLAAVDALPEPATRQSTRVWAIAAALLLAVGAGFLISRIPGQAAPVGEIVYATGGYTVRGSETSSSQLMAGSIVRTSGGGRLLVDLGADRTLRIDSGSSVTLRSPSELWLHGGRIYVDAAGRESVTVVTPFAWVTDVGTQFEVSVAGETLEVSTREGRVDVRLGEKMVRSEARPGRGEHLVIHGLVVHSRSDVPTTGERWDWTQASRPLFAVGQRSVGEYLHWAARESGRTLIFRTELAEQQAGLRRLAGGGEVDADLESVRRVLRATTFRTHAGEPHELIVGLDAE